MYVPWVYSRVGGLPGEGVRGVYMVDVEEERCIGRCTWADLMLSIVV